MKNVGNSSDGRSQGVPKISGHPCIGRMGALRGHLCDSTAFLYSQPIHTPQKGRGSLKVESSAVESRSPTDWTETFISYLVEYISSCVASQHGQWGQWLCRSLREKPTVVCLILSMQSALEMTIFHSAASTVCWSKSFQRSRALYEKKYFLCHSSHFYSSRTTILT